MVEWEDGGSGARVRRANRIARSASVAGLAVALTSCGSGGGATPSYCAPLAELRQHQSRWTVAALAAMTRDELAANWTEQRRYSDGVERELPSDLAARWKQVNEVGARFHDLAVSAYPSSGDGEALLAEATRAGFGSITQYVARRPVDVDGESWTFERLLEVGSTLDQELNTSCNVEPAAESPKVT